MVQSGGDSLEPKGRKGKSSKAPKPQDTKSKIKISAYISVESIRRLGIHATMTGQDKSAIIDGLIREHLRDWVVQYRPNAKGGGDAGPELESEAAG